MRYKQKSKPVDNNQPSLTYITKDTEIKADMQSDVDVRIEGSVEGEVETKQQLILNESGKIKGAIISAEAVIYGEVIGDVFVSNKLTVHSSAIIDGEISAKKLIIKDGAQIKGALKVGPDGIQKQKSTNNISSSVSSIISA